MALSKFAIARALAALMTRWVVSADLFSPPACSCTSTLHPHRADLALATCRCAKRARCATCFQTCAGRTRQSLPRIWSSFAWSGRRCATLPWHFQDNAVLIAWSSLYQDTSKGGKKTRRPAARLRAVGLLRPAPRPRTTFPPSATALMLEL